jgi:Skp family chaperone for outer membrane proteins
MNKWSMVAGSGLLVAMVASPLVLADEVQGEAVQLQQRTQEMAMTAEQRQEKRQERIKEMEANAEQRQEQHQERVKAMEANAEQRQEQHQERVNEMEAKAEKRREQRQERHEQRGGMVGGGAGAGRR